MQDFDVTTTAEDAEASSSKQLQVEQLKAYGLLIFKRLIAFICFGPGVVGFLWIIARILRR